MGSCEIMMKVEDIVQDINRTYQITLDPAYIERIKRLSCGYLCGGVCRQQYIVELKKGGSHNV